MKIKEYGSNFHFETSGDYLLKNNQSFYFKNELKLFLSGRAALYSIITLGIKKHNWKRVYFPSYYCHEVITPLKELDIEVTFYDINPFENKVNLGLIEDSDTFVFVNVNYFGIFLQDVSSFNNLFIIDDLTYSNLDATTSSAHYCFGSLRKELPITVGGFCSSPQGLELPYTTENDYGIKAHRDRLLAMTLKAHYLNTGIEFKDYFLKLFLESEMALDHTAALSGMPEEAQLLLKSLDAQSIYEQKTKNLTKALSLINLIDGVSVNIDNKSKGFGLMFYFAIQEKRDRVRAFLIDNKIYPAILWPNQLSNFAKDIENRVLFVHIDYRYKTSEIDFIVDCLNQSFYE